MAHVAFIGVGMVGVAIENLKIVVFVELDFSSGGKAPFFAEFSP